MKKYIMLIMALLLISIPCVMAQTGGLRISPALPIMVESPATFTVWAQSADSYDVNVLLVVTEECYDGMPDHPAVVVAVDYDTTPLEFTKNDFIGVTGMGNVKVPPSGTTMGANYTAAALKDHLDYGLSEPLESDDTIYWAMGPLADPDFDPLTSDPKEITVTLDSSDPRMLVYLLGKSVNDADLFDMRVPPTIPGFLIPEVAIGSIMAVAAMFTALGLFAYKKKHISTK